MTTCHWLVYYRDKVTGDLLSCEFATPVSARKFADRVNGGKPELIFRSK